MTYSNTNYHDNKNGKLKWYVVWCPRLRGWAVKLGEFQDSWETSKYLAEQRRDHLNRSSNFGANEGFLVDGFV